MAVSGKRAGVEFSQEIQTPLVTILESGLPAMVVGPFYQVVEALDGETINQDAVAKDSAGSPVLYKGNAIEIYFFSDIVNLTGALAIPSLLDKSLVLPNNQVATDPFFKVLLVSPGTSNFVQLDQNVGFELIAGVSGAGTNRTVGIRVFSAQVDSSGKPFTPGYFANVVIGFRALRRDYARRFLKTDVNGFSTIAGGDEFGPENPAALGLNKVLEVAQSSFQYLVALDEVSDAEPEGTYGAYLRAIEVLSTIEGYTLVPLSRGLAVQNAMVRHILDMSEETNRKERIVLLNTELPTNGSNDIGVSGIGDLDLIHAYFEQSLADAYHVIGEARRGGAAVNNKLAYRVLAGTGSGPILVSADFQVLATSVVGSVVTGSSNINETGAFAISTVGKVVRYSVTGTVDLTGNQAKANSPVRQFRGIGLDVGDDFVITAGVHTGTYKILGFSTSNVITNPNGSDIVILEGLAATPAVLAQSYSAAIDNTVLSFIDADNVLLEFPFDITTAVLAYSVLDPTEQVITVDKQGGSGVMFDSLAFVSALNADPDVAALATFFVGPSARAGIEVPNDPGIDFTLGADTFTQFFTNADVSAVAAGSSPNYDDGDFLDLESENRDFGIKSVRLWNGSIVVHDPNTDLTGVKLTESFSIYTPGDPLVITTPLGDEPDIQGQAESLATFPQRFKSRRVRSIWPDLGVTTIRGIQQEVPGYYIACTIAGMIATIPSEQGYSELPIPGWEGLVHSNDLFKERQLELLTSAGHWVLVQDVDGGPIVCRKQYTTDVSGDLTAEASFTTVTDDFAKTCRVSVKPLLGVNNITPELVERVSMIIQGVIALFVGRKALKSATLNSLEPSTAPGDLTTMVGDVDLEFYGPFNLLRMRLLL